jgi:hypothetical protein
VENHDRQSNCHVPDPEAPCESLTFQDGQLYKVGATCTCLSPWSLRYSAHAFTDASMLAIHSSEPIAGPPACGHEPY